MSLQLLVPIFERRHEHAITVVTLGLGEHNQRASGRNLAKLENQLLTSLREIARKMPARDVELFQAPRGLRLEKVRIELSLSGEDERKKVSGEIPLVVEPRWMNEETRVEIAYHPEDGAHSFPVRKDLSLEEQAKAYFAKVWARWPESKLRGVLSHGHENVRSLAFSIEPRSLLDSLPDDKPVRSGVSMGAESASERRTRGRKVLPRIGTNLTELSVQGSLPPGLARGRQAAELGLLMGGAKRQPAVVVGPPGVGKTTVIHRWIHEALVEDGYYVHRNVDRVRDVWLVSGKRLIAGMVYLGDWEKRAIDLLDDARRDRCVLVIEDLHHFSRIGRSRGSDRNLTDLFRGPLARREVVMVGECTADQWRALEDDAPAFASLFTPIRVEEATSAETFRLLLHEARTLEQKRKLTIGPFVLRSLVEMSTSVLPGRALPGKAIDLVRELARDHEEGTKLEEADVSRLLSKKTGVPKVLLDRDETLDPDELVTKLSREIVGQPEAVRVAADLICRIKAGTVDPRRPYGVLLFTGPTGTGKTELAKCIAEYLYGSSGRLLRFDMSELSGPDAPARLIGTRWSPEGLLTKNVQEQPFSVVLFDEIEKAHPSVLYLCLQLFEDGRLTDAAGNTAHFSHTVVIMTSNLGSRARAPVGFVDSPDGVLADVAKAVREFFPPELFNRIDQTVPFRPLSRAAAELVAEKEIEKLVGRRGLADRHVFVARSPAVRAHVADRAFKSEDGARSIKRYLEDSLGALLTDALAGSRPGAVRIFHLFEAKGALRVEHETLDEVEPTDATFPLEPLLERPVEVVRQELVGARAVVAQITEEGAPDSQGGRSTALERIAVRMRAKLADHGRGQLDATSELYHLEALREAILKLGELLDVDAPKDRSAQYEDVEDREFNVVGYESDSYRATGPQRQKLADRRAGHLRSRTLGKQEALEALAEASFLRRALRRVDEPGEHAIFLELVRGGRHVDRDRFDHAPEGLFEWLALAYRTAFGKLVGWAKRGAGGKITDSSGKQEGSTPIDRETTHLVLAVEGLGARDLARLEEGSHVRTSNAVGPEIVRVRVLPALAGETARDVLREHDERVRAYEAASVAEPLRASESPRALLPVVRTLRFDLPTKQGSSAPLEIEDFALGWAAELNVKTLADALAIVWLLARGRVEPGDAS